ncbi:MAG: hypothetical protein GY789_21535 [Hyphomicrobiales bacterium]|nr:hypothetical protein [Hyphomicrobiales bacterium]MCP4999597.1 hypothetical protein [Hyphomicrobiales bacterium]
MINRRKRASTNAAGTTAALVLAVMLAAPAQAEGLDDMVGCWLADGFPPTSVVRDNSDPKSAIVVQLNALLLFNRIRNTDNLVFGSLFEWNRERSEINGPIFQNGAYDPVAGTLTFGYPGGGLDTARLQDRDKLLYVHTKSGAETSSMSVREMKRIGCDDARKLSKALEEKKNALSE